MVRYHLRREDHRTVEKDKIPLELKCSACEKILPIYNFIRYRNDEGKFCFHPLCRECKRKFSTQYLGLDVAEKVLSKVFPHVTRMPYGNHGYDFVCGKGFKVDVKAACYSQMINWNFNITKFMERTY